RRSNPGLAAPSPRAIVGPDGWSPRSLQAPNRIRLTGGLERGGAPERGLLLLESPCFESVVSRQMTAGLSTTSPGTWLRRSTAASRLSLHDFSRYRDSQKIRARQ